MNLSVFLFGSKITCIIHLFFLSNSYLKLFSFCNVIKDLSKIDLKNFDKLYPNSLSLSYATDYTQFFLVNSMRWVLQCMAASEKTTSAMKRSKNLKRAGLEGLRVRLDFVLDRLLGFGNRSDGVPRVGSQEQKGHVKSFMGSAGNGDLLVSA